MTGECIAVPPRQMIADKCEMSRKNGRNRKSHFFNTLNGLSSRFFAICDLQSHIKCFKPLAAVAAALADLFIPLHFTIFNDSSTSRQFQMQELSVFWACEFASLAYF